MHLLSVNSVNPFTPKSDQDRISPYSINTMSRRQVLRIKISVRQLKVNSIPNSPNQHHENCMADSKENNF